MNARHYRPLAAVYGLCALILTYRLGETHDWTLAALAAGCVVGAIIWLRCDDIAKEHS